MVDTSVINNTVTPIPNTVTPIPNSSESHPWANKHDVEKVVEIIYLIILAATGTLGNLIVIFSIALERRIHAHGNIFVINLAVADLLITGFVVPTVIVNVLHGDNALRGAGCSVAGYLVTVTCTCSLCNLTVIAVNRYFAVVCTKNYGRIFTKKKVYLMVVGTWVWSNALSFSNFLGWGRIAYDDKIELCSWDDDISQSYTIFLVSFAVLLPLIVIFFCYFKLFTTVRSSGKWVRSLSTFGGVVSNSEQNRRSLRKERNLLQTLATAVAFFCICWLPYGLSILIDPHNISPILKKIFGWLGLSNSAVNFVIYGLMNPVFRRGYRNLFYFLFHCKRIKKFGSIGKNGSMHSDSFYRSGTRKRSSQIGTPLSVPRNLNLRKDGSSNNLKQLRANSDISNGTPQFPVKAADQQTIEEILKTSDEANDQHAGEKPKMNIHLPALKRTSNLFKRDRRSNSDKMAITTEEKQIRSSMLLQIQLDEECDSNLEPKRTRSEVRCGIRTPTEKKRSSSVCDATMLTEDQKVKVNKDSVTDKTEYLEKNKISNYNTDLTERVANDSTGKHSENSGKSRKQSENSSNEETKT